MQLDGATELERRTYDTCLRVERELPASELATAVAMALSEAGQELQRLRHVVDERMIAYEDARSAVIAVARDMDAAWDIDPFADLSIMFRVELCEAINALQQVWGAIRRGRHA